MIRLSIVIPCYNEEAVLRKTANRVVYTLRDLVARGKITAESSVYFVDDGSTDSTWQIIEDLVHCEAAIKGIKLSRNRGHQNALVAGLFSAPGDVVISMDADLQHDPAAVEPMIDAHRIGNDIVYGVREDRGSETFFKRTTGNLYYRMLQAMNVDIVPNHADYRLMSRRAINALKQFEEVGLFLRGIIPQLGFSSTCIYYKQADRAAGESKYSLRKMIALAVQGVTSFSTAPLHMITVLGLTVSLVSLGFAFYAIWVKLVSDSALPGWASTVVPMYFLGGIQLLCIGIIGEYLAKIYMETKRRPRYLIERVLGEADSMNGAVSPASKETEGASPEENTLWRYKPRC